jgi:hypothetical protein
MASKALFARLSTLLRSQNSMLNTEKPFHSYGVDSLSGVKRRNWITKRFGVDIPLLVLLGDATVATVAMAITRKWHTR